MKRITLSLLALALTLPVAGAAKTVREPGVDGFCATRLSTTAISYARHSFNQRRRGLERPDSLTIGEPGIQQAFTVTKQKNIAVIEDDGTILPPPNFFDLLNQGVQFKRSGPGTRAEPFPGGVKDARGNVIQLGDDDVFEIDLPFAFTFYGTPYNKVYLYSDGNLAFALEDPNLISSPRSLSRFLEGPPRIAVDFLDLDPSAATGGGSVYLLEESGQVRVTWDDVPQFGLSDSNTFQVTLFPNGRITMAYEGVAANTGIVGVSPGGPGTINLIDLSRQLPTGRKNDAIAEEFRGDSQIDDLAAAKAMFSRVKDEYDLIVLFADFDVQLLDGGGTLAYNAPVKNNIRGLGDAVGYDASRAYGSNGRLEAFVQMGPLANFPGNPNNLIQANLEAEGIAILAHEVGHRWLSYPRFRDDQGQLSTALWGRSGSPGGPGHWSFLMNSRGSLMEGNDIRDDGNGQFRTLAPFQGFSDLDLYMMGFNRASEVQPFFYVSGSQLEAATAPTSGVVITGSRRNVTINQIIAAEGPRVPSFANAQKKIQIAFILLGKQGQPPSLDSIKKVNQYRNRLSTYFNQQTGGRGRIATWLRLKKQQQTVSPAAVTAAPAAGEAPVTDGETPTQDSMPVRLELTKRFDRLEERTRR